MLSFSARVYAAQGIVQTSHNLGVRVTTQGLRCALLDSAHSIMYGDKPSTDFVLNDLYT